MVAILSASTSFSDALGEHGWQAGSEDFFLSLGDVILDATEDDEFVVKIVDGVTGAPISIARLADGADVDEIFRTSLDHYGFCWHFLDAVALDVNTRDVGVAIEADWGELIREI